MSEHGGGYADNPSESMNAQRQYSVNAFMPQPAEMPMRRTDPMIFRDLNQLMSQTMSDVFPIANWDGKLENWDDWYARWLLYAEVCFQHIPESSKVWVLLRYIPDNYRQIILSHVQMDHWDYRKVVEFLHREVQELVPKKVRMDRWLSFMPSEPTYQALQSWFPLWKQRLRNLLVDESLVAEQFICALRPLFT